MLGAGVLSLLTSHVSYCANSTSFEILLLGVFAAS